MYQSTKGSIWRKWDLHIHSPFSVLYNNFAGTSVDEKWNKYLKKLGELNDLAVLGITDYYSIDGYKKVKTHKDNGNLANIDLLLPNVELRILPVTDKSIPINLHVIFSPEIVEELETKFFSSLEFDYQEETYKCVRSDLIRLGKICKNDESLSEELAYKNGANQFKVKIENLKNIFRKNKKLRKNSIIVVPNSNRDGASGIQDSNLIATRENLYRFADCIFSGNQKDRLYFLGKGTDSPGEIIRKYGRLKPCIHGSDAHSLEDIGRACIFRGSKNHQCSADSNCDLRHCWIKSDPTFDGLKQIIYEPEERVKIQQTCPFEDRKKLYFDKYSLSGAKNFIIPNTTYQDFNRELVTIIGGRGSGKSVLLETMAFLNEEHIKEDQNKKKKVIEYYRQNVEDRIPSPVFTLSCILKDKDGKQEEYKKNLENANSLSLPFLYIGQEQLSSLATNDNELTKKICELIYLDFNEFLGTEVIEKARELLARIEQSKAELEDLCGKYPDNKGQKLNQWLENYILKKKEQKNRLSSSATRTLLAEIEKIKDRGIKLRDFKQSLLDIQNNFSNLTIHQQIDEINQNADLLYKKTEIPLIAPLDFSTQKNAIQKKIREIEDELQYLRSQYTEKKNKLAQLGIKEDISVLLQSIDTIQREISNAERDLRLYQTKSRQYQTLIKERGLLYQIIQNYLETIKQKVDKKFLQFLRSRDDSTNEEKNLFERIIKDISIEGTIDFNQDIFCAYILEKCIDRRSLRTIEDVKALIAGKDNKGRAHNITLERLVEWVKTGLNNLLQEEFSFVLQGEERLISFLFTQWPEFLKVKTVVKLKNVPTEKLSVGQRGTVLLKIYLATATVKQIFIVDQPEDNLDNLFIT